MHKVFISYHHDNDQEYKNYLSRLGNKIFRDESVDTGDIRDDLRDERIRQIIRDDYLRDSTVTIVLIGAETRLRKHVDWEIYSSMYDGAVNKKSGILVINLPGSDSDLGMVSHGDDEKRILYPDVTSWINIKPREEYEHRYPRMPARLIDNLCKPEAKISVVPWHRIKNDAAKLEFLVDATHEDRRNCEYDLSRPMRRANS